MPKIINQTAVNEKGQWWWFWCPGCDMWHRFNTQPGQGFPTWTFNGSEDAPTIHPSLLTRYPYGDPPVDQVCHLWLKEGVLHFLNDCTHHLKGQRVPLPDIPTDAL